MKKAVVIGFAFLVLVFWGDVVLHLLLEGLELTLETLELITERFLELLLVLTPYQAQAITAWLGFALLLLLLFVAYRKLTAWGGRIRLKLPLWREQAQSFLLPLHSSLGWPLGLILLFALLLLIAL